MDDFSFNTHIVSQVTSKVILLLLQLLHCTQKANARHLACSPFLSLEATWGGIERNEAEWVRSDLASIHSTELASS